MPIATGAWGPGVVAVPALSNRTRIAVSGGGGPLGSGVNKAAKRVQPFRSPNLNNLSAKFYVISGITKDSAGLALGSVMLDLFLTASDTKIDSVTSDATTGAYSFSVTSTPGPFYIVAYKAGAPDVAGTTVNTLTGT